MSSRRGWREDGVFFEHNSPCRDSHRHRHCDGRWRGVISLGFDTDGRRIRRKVSGKTKAIVQDRLKALHSDVETGVRAQPNYTVRRAADDWLAQGLHGRSPKTIKKNENVLTLSLDQASALLAAVEGTRMHAYIALCLATGIRTEEARALRWEHVDFGDPMANPPVPPS